MLLFGGAGGVGALKIPYQRLKLFLFFPVFLLRHAPSPF
ncbi:MAG: hypothetical protein BSOLF_2340 [Candidatus Carbobacillus altaicus]|uniref:Uncharacterized protein n=1 Tax=Candidatus Carbonibacillus altaicus TaxID=2163959 RepID=A0A2R6XY60_9BACL|nr:MAG: hypothetical protein BSOLF_2340 [Candidatus Carbobacillus altaicus]